MGPGPRPHDDRYLQPADTERLFRLLVEDDKRKLTAPEEAEMKRLKRKHENKVIRSLRENARRAVKLGFAEYDLARVEG